MSVVDLHAPPDVSAIAKALTAYSEVARERYGDRLRGMYLFGSRARGDSKPYSDVDVALVVAGDDVDSLQDARALSDLAYDVLLETGAEIQPWVLAERDWKQPADSTSPDLIEAIKRDGKPVWVP